MNDLYLRGLTGSVVYEFTDDSYDAYSPMQDKAAWDLSSAIMGLGYDSRMNTTRTLTFRPSPDKAAARSSADDQFAHSKWKRNILWTIFDEYDPQCDN